MDLRGYLRILRKWWVVIVACLLLGVALASTLSILTVPKYQAATKVFVSVQSGGTIADLTQGSSFSQGQVKSYADVITTPVVLQPVIDKLGLQTTAQSLATNVTATTSAGTVVVEIVASDPSAQQAANIANAIAQSFESTVSSLVPADATGASPVKITILQQALTPSEPFSPNVRLNLATGGIIGLILGFAIALIFNALDTRVRNERDVEGVTDAPILGGIAYDAKASERPLVVQDNPRSPRAESFRTLRTNLQYLVASAQPRCYVITSSVAGEGKSTSAANLAIVTAEVGIRVVIVDADLRKPKMAEYLGVEGGAGLTDVLVGRAELGDVLQPWGTHDLYVLPAGRIPPNPSELLSSPAMVELIKTLESQFDLVLFDAPPLLPVTDAAILAKHTGGAIVVVSSGRVHKGQLKVAIDALGNAGSRIAGIVLTMVPTRGPDSYGYGSYGYGYGIEFDEKPSRGRKAKAEAKDSSVADDFEKVLR